MLEVTPLSMDRLVTTLKQMDVKYLRTDDGSLVTLFAPRSAQDQGIEVFLSVGGTDDHILEIYATLDREFGPDDWPSLLASINDWHRSHRWPTGHLAYLNEPGQSPRARLIAECHTLWATGVHEELLFETLRVSLGSCLHFLREVYPPLEPHIETISAEELEEWFTER